MKHTSCYRCSSGDVEQIPCLQILNDSSHEPGGGPSRLLGGFAGDTKKIIIFIFMKCHIRAHCPPPPSVKNSAKIIHSISEPFPNLIIIYFRGPPRMNTIILKY